MVTAIQGLKLSGVVVVVVEDRSYGTVFISNHFCSGMCLGVVHFFAKVSLRISLSLTCAQKRMFRTPV